MTETEIIKNLELTKSAVEWEYPLDFAIACEEAISIIKKYQTLKYGFLALSTLFEDIDDD